MQWFKKLTRPKQNRFLQLLIRQAEFAVEANELLIAYLRTPGPEMMMKSRAIEKEADEVRRILVAELNRTFVTPMDREDIHALSRNLDDVVDYAYTTVEEMEMFEIEPNDHLMRITRLLRDASVELHLGMLRLEDHPAVSSEHAQRAKALENQVERVYREALSELFHTAHDFEHILAIMKQREVYRHLSNAADRGDEAANNISDIVVKMT